MLLCEVLYTLLSQIHRQERFGVFGLEILDDVMKTGACFGVELRRSLGRCFKLASQQLERLFLRLVPAVSVDYSIAEQAVEPRNCRFILLEFPLVLEGAKIAVLKNVFSQRSVGDPSSDKGKEELSLSQKFV